MGNKHLNRSLIPQSAANKQQTFKYINKNPSLMDAWSAEGNSATVFMSVRFVQHDFQCFSDWKKVEMNSFGSFSKKLHQQTWTQVYSSAGKTEKSGLAYTVIPIDKYPNSVFTSSLVLPESQYALISENKDVPFSEIRNVSKMEISDARLYVKFRLKFYCYQKLFFCFPYGNFCRLV